MRPILALLCALFLTACVGNPQQQAVPALHDFGDAAGNWPSPGFPVSEFRVRAVSWLDSPTQYYRLSYTDDLNRRAYAASRWVAPPAELLERFLQRRLVLAQPEAGRSGCRIVIMLDELEQRFTSAQQSQVVLEARANLLPPFGDARLARRAFIVRQDAPTPDARGGVQATRAAANALSGELAQWLGDLARERPQAINICKEKP